MFEVTNSLQCPIKEFKLMTQGSDQVMNVNFGKSILVNGAINGTDEELVIRNNIKVDTQFTFSLMAVTWGNRTAR